MTPAAAPGTLYAGTSGFAYQEWKGPFYPADLPAKKMLSHYASVLPSVEINYTFRRLPSDAVLEGWRSQTPEGFRLTLKAPQRITHIRRLVGAAGDVDEFVRKALSLGDRLGVVLFQLPPTLVYSRELLEGFLSSLPPVVRAAMEFRHESWGDPEVAKLLEAHGVAVCAADTDAKALASIEVTAPHVYLRLRKVDYGADEIAAWGARVRALLDEGRDVYCYFKHEGGGVGPAYAKALLETATG
ncbi:MAG: hypothetical protein QOD62_240 [Actinomycetota bacterium]|nr:hypothetical protein [Actinomycetota bacterium]